MRKIIFFLFLMIGLLISNTKTIAQTDTFPDDFCISADEYQLYLLINDYRKAFAQTPIILSKSLSYVAKTHARDLAGNFNPDSSCNMHSWSDKGKWTPICYPSEQSKKNNVRLKAKEIIGYPSEAFEITYWSNVENPAQQILSFWCKKMPSKNLLLNLEEWDDVIWNAIGIGIEEGYAVVWLGKMVDNEIETEVCGTSTKIVNKSSPLYVATHIQENLNNSAVYYIIIGSYNNRNDGINAVNSYKEMGYSKTILVESDNKIRVAIDYFTDKNEANKALKKYAQKFKGAWILVI